jgi:HPt (histidine-containing phosphotransfer) domain-containing protein
MIHTVLRGTFGKDEALFFLQVRSEYMESNGMPTGPVVEVRQLTRQFKASLVTRQILCGKNKTDLGPIIQPTHIIIQSRDFHPEWLLAGRLAPGIHYTRTQQNGEFLAARILHESGAYAIEQATPDKRDSHQKFTSEDLSERFSVILPEIIFSEITGNLNERIIKERFQFEQNYIGENVLPDTPYFRIIRWRETSSLGVRELRFFLNETFKSNRKLPCRALIVQSDNPEIKKLLQNSQKLFPVEIHLVDSFAEALGRIRNIPETLMELNAADEPEESIPSGETTCHISRSEIGELRNFLLIAHARDKEIVEDHVDSIAPDHPLREIYRAFAGYVRQTEDLKKTEGQKNLLIKGELRRYRTLYTLGSLLGKSDSTDNSAIPVLLKLIRHELDLSYCSILTVEEPLKERSFRFTQTDKKQETEDTLTGTILPLALGLFLAGSEISVFTPEIIMTEAALRDDSLKPWLRAFLQKRKLTSAAMVYFLSRDNEKIWLYLERDKEPEDFPFSQFDPLVREIHLVLRQWRSGAFTHGGSLETSPPMNIDETVEEFGGDKAFMLKLLREFIAEIPEKKETTRMLSAGGNQDKNKEVLRGHLHKIKGAAANLFCDDIRNAAEDFENAVKADCPGAWERCRNRLNREMDRLETFVEKITE